MPAVAERQPISGVLAGLDHEAVVRRIANGEYLAHIAPEFGVTKQALQYQIRKHPKYQEAREIGCELRLDQAMGQFDALNIPRPPLKPLPDPEADEATRTQRMEQWKQEYQSWKDALRLSSFDLARVEAQFRSICWQAEREFPHRWGAKGTTINIGATNLAISGEVLGGLGDLIALANRTATSGVEGEENPMKSVEDSETTAT